MLLDLSAVTDGLVAAISGAWQDAPIWSELGLAGPSFTPTFTGLAPNAIRDGQGPQLSLFLYHVDLDNARESLFWDPTMQRASAAPTSFMPLALNLYYLLSTYSEGSYAEEQQAMSVAMRVFHARPILSSDSSDTPAWTLTMTMEKRSYDELSLLWQAAAVPMRLAVVYRAAVVFLAPDTPPAAAGQVEVLNAEVNGTDTVTITTADVEPPGQ
jgi:hypothetical protein